MLLWIPVGRTALSRSGEFMFSLHWATQSDFEPSVNSGWSRWYYLLSCFGSPLHNLRGRAFCRECARTWEQIKWKEMLIILIRKMPRRKGLGINRKKGGGEDKKGWGWPRKGEEVHSVSWKNEVLFAVLLSASVIKLSSSFTQSDQLIKEAESSLQSKFCVVK